MNLRLSHKTDKEQNELVKCERKSNCKARAQPLYFPNADGPVPKAQLTWPSENDINSVCKNSIQCPKTPGLCTVETSQCRNSVEASYFADPKKFR